MLQDVEKDKTHGRKKGAVKIRKIKENPSLWEKNKDGTRIHPLQEKYDSEEEVPSSKDNEQHSVEWFSKTWFSFLQNWICFMLFSFMEAWKCLYSSKTQLYNL